MDFDDFERANKERQRRRFDLFQDAFNKAMQEKGDPRTLDDLMGQRRDNPPPQDGGAPDAHQQLMETAMEISDATGLSPKAAVLYAMGLCRSIVRHQLAGGTVQFVDADGKAKTLKSKVK